MFAMSGCTAAGAFLITEGVWNRNNDYSGIGVVLVATGVAQSVIIVRRRLRGDFGEDRTAGSRRRISIVAAREST
jgi:hypothetical protein